MDFTTLAHERRSVRTYETGVQVSDETLEAIFQEVVLSPSSFNLQHWAFIAVRDAVTKAKMQEAAWGQQQVLDSSVAILVAGKLNAYEDAPAIYKDVPGEVRTRMLPMIEGFYAGDNQKQRDEAIRSGSLAGMALMFAAKNHGFDTGPMIGFDQAAMAELLHLPANYVPVMLVVLGRRTGELRPRDYRRPLHEVVKLDTFDGPGLGAAAKA